MQNLNENINLDLNQYQLQNFQNFTLNTFTANLYFVKFIEHLLATENEEAKHCYHKICINVSSMMNDLDTLSMQDFLEQINQLLGINFIPVQYYYQIDEDLPQNNHISFYVNSLNFVLKIIGRGFVLNIKSKRLPVRFTFNDKQSIHLFKEKITIEEIVSDAVNKRRNEDLELDLSDFCNSKVFITRQVNFYKLSLLSLFKILMLRVGREIKKLNLSNNGLIAFPVEVLNFFIKGPLVELNLSHNMLETINDFQLNPKLEILWLQGNPFCDDFTPLNYVKKFVMKCPKLKELDGIPVNQMGIIFPVWKNYVHENDPILQDLTGRFIEMYFLSFDSEFRKRVHKFYDDDTFVSISTWMEEEEERAHLGLSCMCRNWVHEKCRVAMLNDEMRKIFTQRAQVVSFLTSVLPKITHDPTTFNVDVIPLFENAIMIVMDGVFRTYHNAKLTLENVSGYFSFRRSFILNKQKKRFLNKEFYLITNDMITVTKASQEQIENSFKTDLFNPMHLDLLNPTKDQKSLLIYCFSELSETSWNESEKLLSSVNWNMRIALLTFMRNLRNMVCPRPMLPAATSTMVPQSSMEIDNFEFDFK